MAAEVFYYSHINICVIFFLFFIGKINESIHAENVVGVILLLGQQLQSELIDRFLPEIDCGKYHSDVFAEVMLFQHPLSKWNR